MGGIWTDFIVSFFESKADLKLKINGKQFFGVFGGDAQLDLIGKLLIIGNLSSFAVNCGFWFGILLIWLRIELFCAAKCSAKRKNWLKASKTNEKRW